MPARTQYPPAPGQVTFDTINVDRPTYSVNNPIHQIAGRGNQDPNDPRTHQEDPSQDIPGTPPNHGDFILPHVTTFQGVVSTISRVYRPSDEAIKASLDNARFMRNDLVVMECLEQRQRSTALLDWHLEPEDEGDTDAQWIVEQLTPIIEQIPRFVQYRENCLHAIWYGRYAVSNQYRWAMIRGKRRMVLHNWVPVNGDKLVFRYDDGSFEFDPDQVGIRVGAGYTTVENLASRWDQDRHRKVEATDYGLAYFLDPWEREFLTIHKHQIEDGEYEEPTHAGRIHGLGLRSKIYWTWFQKQEALAFLMEFLERSAFGIEVWYYPWGNDQAEAKTRKAAEERIGGGRNIILVPKPLGDDANAYGIDHVEPGMAGADVLKDILTNYFGHLIKRYILGQTLTTEAESTGLGSNLASVHLDTYLQIIRYDAINLQETITRDLIDVLVKHNWPHLRDHKVKFVIETEAPDVEAKLAAWRQAFEMGTRLKASDVYELIAAEPPEAEDEVLENPEVGEAAAQQQQMQTQQGMDQQRLGMEQQQADFDQQQTVEQAEYTKEKDRQDLERELLTAQPFDATMEGPVERYDGAYCQHCGTKHDADGGERVPMCSSDQSRRDVEEYAARKDSPGQKTLWDESSVTREPSGKSEGGQFTASEGGGAKSVEDGMEVQKGDKLTGVYDIGAGSSPFTGTVESIDEDTAGGGFSRARIALDEPISLYEGETPRKGIIATLGADGTLQDSKFKPSEGAAVKQSLTTDSPATIEVRGKTLEVWQDGGQWFWRTPGSTDSIAASEALKGVIEGKLADTDGNTDGNNAKIPPDAQVQSGQEVTDSGKGDGNRRNPTETEEVSGGPINPHRGGLGAMIKSFATGWGDRMVEMAQDHARSSQNILKATKRPTTDYRIALVPTGDITPSQTGEDYENDSSRYTATMLKAIQESTESLDDVRKDDFAPVTLDSELNIIDGNHRHYANTENKASHMVALVPLDNGGNGNVSNIDEFSHAMTSGDMRSLVYGEAKPHLSDDAGGADGGRDEIDAALGIKKAQPEKKKFSRQIAQFQRAYYNLASEPDEAAWWQSTEPGELRALSPTGPVRYVKYATGGFSAEPIYGGKP